MLLDEGCVHLMREAIGGHYRQSEVINEDRVLVASGDCVHLGVGKGVRVEHTA
jgi:hypothetical protein